MKDTTAERIQAELDRLKDLADELRGLIISGRRHEALVVLAGICPRQA